MIYAGLWRTENIDRYILEKYLWPHLKHSFFGKGIRNFGTEKSGLFFWTGTSEALQKFIHHEAVRCNADNVKYLENKHGK